MLFTRWEAIDLDDNEKLMNWNIDNYVRDTFLNVWNQNIYMDWGKFILLCELEKLKIFTGFDRVDIKKRNFGL